VRRKNAKLRLLGLFAAQHLVRRQDACLAPNACTRCCHTELACRAWAWAALPRSTARALRTARALISS